MKIISRSTIASPIDAIKAAGKTLVFTNGCFDILHAGHVRYLAAAKALGDFLMIGLNSDTSVRNLKGASRPINNQEDRAEVLAALAVVDYVVVFDELTAEKIIAEVKPDIYVKGGDYQVKDLPEANIVEALGGRIVLVPEVPGRSSSNIIRKISEDK
ncbi:D-glycero-beta-D-manno-heptose 1-phosphate adenylyltransferase [Sporomusa sphaeroides]|uniref:D-glycero-beta-D-manno-heptose 1-phosphate adenylyltransferase n=1 Tax=Sporomusa sphaeroides TaxID=47679 RepID=UPI003D9FB692